MLATAGQVPPERRKDSGRLPKAERTNRRLASRAVVSVSQRCPGPLPFGRADSVAMGSRPHSQSCLT